MPFRRCESSETIQREASTVASVGNVALDCFASLAMTEEETP
jgi:hypothetical protein